MTHDESHVLIGCTHDLLDDEKWFWSLFLGNSSWSVESWACFYQKWLHLKCDDKDFQKDKGHRRLILNLVTKIRNLKLKSITAWRGWLESRKVVLKQEEIFQRHFIEAHSTKARPPETLTKLLQCSTNWAMITHTLAASQFFDLFETWNEDNVNCISTRYDVSGCNSKLSNYKLTKKNKGL